MQRKSYIAKATYSFAVDGGAVGAIIPATSELVPQGAIVTRAWTDVRTAMTSGGSATVALSVASATPITLKSATAFDDAAYTGVDSHSVTAAKTDSEGRITFTVAVAALTAGIVDIYVEYLL